MSIIKTALLTKTRDISLISCQGLLLSLSVKYSKTGKAT
jgi:hypothetical protein